MYSVAMFLKKGLVALVYVDDVLFFGTSDKMIDKVIRDLKKNFDLSKEGIQLRPSWVWR